MKTNHDDNQTPNPYGIDKLSNIKPGVKIGFLKYWAAAGTYFLIYMAQGFQSSDNSTELLALFLLTTLMFEYVVNKVIVWMNTDKDPTTQYLPFYFVERKRFLSLLFSMIYCLTMTVMCLLFNFILVKTFDTLNIPTLTMLLHPDATWDSCDPITFGFLWIFTDMLWMSIRRLVIHIKNSKKPIDEREPKVYIQDNEFPEPEKPKEYTQDDKQKIKAYENIIKDSKGNNNNEE